MDVKKRTEDELAQTAPQKESERSEAGAFWRSVGRGILYALTGYFLGGAVLPYGAQPLGIALLCASDRGVLPLFAGLCLRAWGDPFRSPWLITYSAILLVRLLTGVLLESAKKDFARESHFPFLFSEHLSLRASSAAVGAFGMGLFRLIEGDFLYYDLYGAILGTLSAPTAVLLLSGLFDGGRSVRRSRLCLGQTVLSCALAFSMGSWSPYGIRASVLLCLFSALYLTRRQGTVAGITAGALCGLVTTPLLAPAFAFGALSMGLLGGVSLALGAGSAFLCAVAWCGYAQGMGLLNGTLPALIGAALLFPVIERMFYGSGTEEQEEPVPQEKEEKETCSPLWVGEEDGLRLAQMSRRLQLFSQGFSSLAHVMEQIGKQTSSSSATDLRQICEGAFTSCCTSCTQREDCWGAAFTQTEREIDSLSTVLHRRGQVTQGDVAASLSLRCPRLPDLIEEVNHRASEYRRQSLLCDRTELFALDYSALSELLEQALRLGRENACRDEELTAALCRRLATEGAPVSAAAVLNGRPRRILLRWKGEEPSEQRLQGLRESLEQVCGFPLEEGAFERSPQGLVLTERPRLKISSATRTVCARGEEEYCGDTAGLFFDGDGRLYGLISDGMGSGQEAALTSGLAGLFLRRLLVAGIPCAAALRLLNGFLRGRSDGSLHECTATVDLMELDLLEGRAFFYKSGAAPTYVFREDSVFKLRSRTVPLGILRDVDLRRIHFRISAGDVIVMVSDGVTQLKEECPWLFDLLKSRSGGGEREISAERLADLIVKYAREEGSSDDLSVLVIRVEENP